MWKCLSVFVIIVTSTATTSLPENGSFPCSFLHGDVNISQFKCQEGTDCIRMEHVCDGIRHCSDSSDETFCLLSNKRSRRSNACILPAYPNHGTYKVLNNPHARPGQSSDSVALTVHCRRGYGVVNKDGSNGNGTEVFCVDGKWYQNIPQCVRFCKLEPDPSVRYMCHVPGVGLKVCGNYVAPGTLVSPVCNTPFYYSTESFPKMKCNTGFWNYVAQCKAECGRVSPEAFQLVIDGKEAKRGELPWHVGIYRKGTDTLEQICGGSLVSNNVVISAAHCFWSDVRKLLPASNYKVAIGKLYRPWDSKRDVGVQKSDIKKIKIPSLFEGEAANFQEDIAILILTTPFVYQTYVRPVCLSFDINFERWQLQQGNSGKVAGWGLTTANGNASPILKVVDMPFINEINCIKTLPPSFREYITGDKFCAGYTNGTALCRGDSGGGLAFTDRELGIDRYYLRGIVSAAPRNDEKMCNDNAYTTFTKITKHQEFINDALAESASRTCPFYSFQCVDGSCVDQGADCDGKQDCADGSDESNELCKPPVDTDIESQASDACILPPYPNHGSYTVANVSNAKPGQRLETFVLTVSCSKGYKIINTRNGITLLDQEVSCNNGVWYQKLPKCVPADCECVPPSSCPPVLRGTLGKSEALLCTSPSDEMTLICCMDHKLMSDRESQASDACILPPYPDHGSYTVANVSNAKPGQRLETFVLTVSCSKGYNIIIPSKGLILPDVEVSCNNGVWYQKLPKCVPADCEIKGRKGRCVPSSLCPPIPRGTLGKSKTPLCTSPSDKMPLICCTDHELVSDREVLLFNPLLRIPPKIGSNKARDKCIEYIKTLDYPCKTDDSLQNNTKLIDHNELCYPENRRKQGGEMITAVRDSLRNEFPHMALLGYGDTMDKVSWQCSGSVISERFILTAAECTFYPELGPVKYIALGILKRSDPVEMWQQYNVKSTIIHPDYNVHLYHNVALLETDRQIVFSSSVLPACLYEEYKTANYEYLPGFGVLIDPILRGDNLQSVLKTRFKGKYSNPSLSQPRRPIDDIIKSEQESNQGGIVDPLRPQNIGQCPFLILGIFRHPVNCDANANYTSFTDIQYYVEWIENIVWPELKIL